MEKKKTVKITITFVIVLALLLVGYFLIVNQENNEVLSDMESVLGNEDGSVMGDVLETNNNSIVILDSSLNEINIFINDETKFAKIPIGIWFYNKSIEINKFLISSGDLKIRDFVVSYINDDFTATKIIVLEFGNELGVSE